MNRCPVAGDLIYTGNKQIELLVVSARQVAEGDNYAGCTYYTFDAVRTSHVNAITGAIDGSKVKTYYTNVHGATYPETKLEDITLVGTAKFKTVTTTEYFIKKIKDV